MRTTLTIDDTIDAHLRDIARKQNRSYKEVVNEALARGVQQLSVASPPEEYRITPKAFGFQPGVDRKKLNQLYDEQEAEP